MEVKELLMKQIETHDYTSFTELEKCMERANIDYKGDMCWHLDNYPNLILWSGWKIEFFRAINDLLREKKIDIHHDNTCGMCYIIDGRLLQLPTAKKMVQYKEPHWLPITFSKRGVTE